MICLSINCIKILQFILVILVVYHCIFSVCIFLLYCYIIISSSNTTDLPTHFFIVHKDRYAHAVTHYPTSHTHKRCKLLQTNLHKHVCAHKRTHYLLTSSCPQRPPTHTHAHTHTGKRTEHIPAQLPVFYLLSIRSYRDVKRPAERLHRRKESKYYREREKRD